MAKLSQEQIAAQNERMAERRERFRGGGGKYLKFSSGYNLIRFILDKTKEKAFLYMRQHKWKADRLTSALDLDFVMRDEEAREMFKAKLAPTEVALIQAFGDPFTFLARAMQVDWQDSKLNWLLPKNTYVFALARHVKEEEYEFGVVEKGKEFFEQVIGLVTDREVENEATGEMVQRPAKAPNLFDEEIGPGVELVGNGKDGNQRRYDPIEPLSGGEGAIIVPDEERPDLDRIMANRFQPWTQKYKYLVAKFGEQHMADYGLGFKDVQKVAGDVAGPIATEDVEEKEAVPA